MVNETEFLNYMDTNQGIIHKICHLYTDSKDDYHDLFQEIILQLWKAFPQFRGEAKISTWMYRIAFYTAMTNLRKSKKNIVDIHDSIPDISQDENSREEDEMIIQLKTAISKLPKIDMAITLLILEDKSYKEISEITGLTENTVGVRINRIKKKLKQLLTDGTGTN